MRSRKGTRKGRGLWGNLATLEWVMVAQTRAEKQEANNAFIPALPGVPDRKHSARFPGWAAGWAPRHVRSSRIS